MRLEGKNMRKYAVENVPSLLVLYLAVFMVMDAYNLEMQGKAGAAKTLLEQHVLKNPNDTTAHF